MPTSKNGKICYVEMPASDARRSAEFYERAFGWQTRRRGDGALAFDDTTGEVSGAFVSNRPPAGTPDYSFTSWWTAWLRLLRKSPPMGDNLCSPSAPIRLRLRR